jgi:hypothetical protein
LAFVFESVIDPSFDVLLESIGEMFSLSFPLLITNAARVDTCSPAQYQELLLLGFLFVWILWVEGDGTRALNTSACMFLANMMRSKDLELEFAAEQSLRAPNLVHISLSPDIPGIFM